MNIEVFTDDLNERGYAVVVLHPGYIGKHDYKKIQDVMLDAARAYIHDAALKEGVMKSNMMPGKYDDWREDG